MGFKFPTESLLYTANKQIGYNSAYEPLGRLFFASPISDKKQHRGKCQKENVSQYMIVTCRTSAVILTACFLRYYKCRRKYMQWRK